MKLPSVLTLWRICKATGASADEMLGIAVSSGALRQVREQAVFYDLDPQLRLAVRRLRRLTSGDLRTISLLAARLARSPD